ncbi:MAG: SusD/RagB family nutrient-binding outer membrane lipoprotein [Bacteroidales bacterium]|nr:SusD/RagB family nutrient-binding outer membrane lipoprotein [Bacteroidales bacterium]
MKKIFHIIITVAVLALFIGCDDFLDVNTSKDSPTSVTVDQALPPAIFYASQQVYDHAEYAVYLAQALTTAGKSQTSTYAYSSGWEFLSMNRHPQWRRHFYDLGANIEELKKAAEKIDSKNFILIARTIMLQSTMFTTDVFGDMPRSKVYLDTSPAYDSQEDIYDWMFQEADELVELYANPEWAANKANIRITKKMDRIYEGNLKKWELYTKALRARLWLRKLPNWENTPEVCNKIIGMVDEVLNDPAWQEPRFNYTGGTSEQNAPWGPYAPIINAWESRGNRLATSIPTKFFAYGVLGAYDNNNSENARKYALDPRVEKLMTMRDIADKKGSTRLRWLESNIGMDVSMRVTNYPDLYGSGDNPYTLNDGYIALITDEELMFIKAEAQYWAGDKAGAYNTAKNATIHNMKRLGIVESELVGNALKRYNVFFEVRFPGESLFTIADLMQQKYVAMYLQPELWNDMRRYNYSSKTNGITYDNVPVYTITTCHNGKGTGIGKPENFSAEYSLRRPYNLYVPYWMQEDAFGQNAELSPNAWINRLNYDPETEDKYNKKELERLGAYKNAEWLKKRMIWQYNNSGKAVASDPTEWK